MSRRLYLAAFAYLGACLFALAPSWPAAQAAGPFAAPAPAAPGPAGTSGREWFGQVRTMCNPVEVDVGMRRRPPPPGSEGSAYQAACYALAGKIDLARQVIRALPAGERAGAAGLFLSIADPVADAGDDRAAGPMMRLVLEFVPDSYIALYHAGMSEYALGERRAAELHLRRFLQVYAAEDGFRARAREVLAEMGAGPGT
jgi:hypothetical protein